MDKAHNTNLTAANMAEKTVNIIRQLEAEGYDAFEIFILGEQILKARATASTAAHVEK